MRGKGLIFLMAGFMVAFEALTGIAQVEKEKAQLYYVEDVLVKPSMVGEFEAAVREYVAQCARYKFPYPSYVYNADDFHYYLAYPVENYAAIDSLHKAWGELDTKMGAEQVQALNNRFEGTYEYFRHFVIRYMPELSYAPEKPRLKPEEEHFVYLDFYYFLPEMEKEEEQIGREWVELYKRKNIPYGYSLYAGVMGTDMPLYIMLLKAKSAADYFSQSVKIRELLGEERKGLLKRTLDGTRKVEKKTGKFRPDLSYIPKDK